MIPYHPDLGGTVAGLPGQIWTNRAEQGGLAGVDDDGNGYVDDAQGWDFVALAGVPSGQLYAEDYLDEDDDPNDYAGHGTMVAGLVGALTDNTIGVAGMAWQVRLMPLRIGWAESSSPLGLRGHVLRGPGGPLRHAHGRERRSTAPSRASCRATSRPRSTTRSARAWWWSRPRATTAARPRSPSARTSSPWARPTPPTRVAVLLDPRRLGGPLGAGAGHHLHVPPAARAAGGQPRLPPAGLRHAERHVVLGAARGGRGRPARGAARRARAAPAAAAGHAAAPARERRRHLGRRARGRATARGG